MSNLKSRGPASVEICTLLRKPDAMQMEVDVKYIGFDIPNEFVVGYGLDYAEQYRNLRSIGDPGPARLLVICLASATLRRQFADLVERGR